MRRTFEFYIDDDRYSVPTLQIVTADDDDDARKLAEGLLRNGPHYLSIEVCELTVPLFTVCPPSGRDSGPMDSSCAAG